ARVGSDVLAERARCRQAADATAQFSALGERDEGGTRLQQPGQVVALDRGRAQAKTVGDRAPGDLDQRAAGDRGGGTLFVEHRKRGITDYARLAARGIS